MAETKKVGTSNVTPVVIQAFNDKKLQSQTGKFTLPINPENYAMSYKVEVDQSGGHGNSGSDIKYKKTPPEQLKLEFIFDNTGTVMGNTLDGTPVQEQVRNFMTVTYHVDGESHKPHYLKVMWGDNLMTGDVQGFNCMLTQLDVNYTLFARTGEPLRAKLTAQFTNYVEQEARLQNRQDHRSPDLTHVRTVEFGDRLPLMTQKIYDDQSYYLKVAKANGLTSFRRLKTGANLVFPPIQES
ncbi:CIS tube protein [Spirosoma validum]|uniref:LysM peptidoglycan-binding domain-containing protein n=1 Tax=Spirosoma validum TaxID=2771355 RepID=A0A927B0Q5_9BACT|nr:LysM peptidoglycan-binding domain-containing protein [Spirosoma validum]MBD2753198.1 LysM peptidoglycan-binding domain-containing protein [Spirosoma validum]